MCLYFEATHRSVIWPLAWSVGYFKVAIEPGQGAASQRSVASRKKGVVM